MMKTDFTTCSIVNGPLIVLNFTVNLFFTCCMISQKSSREEVKQPLKLLLWSIISSTISYMFAFAALLLFVEHRWNLHVMSMYAFCTCLTSSAWLNFFYCTQIIPAQQTLFTWIKKNVKSVIYCIWIFERMGCLFGMTCVLIFGYDMDSPSNFTLSTPSRLQGVIGISCMISLVYFSLCLCVMVGSSAATAVYLCRHIRRTVTNESPFSCPRFKSQARVTFTGILQGVVYLFCSALIMGTWIDTTFAKDTMDNCVPRTFVTIFMSFTAFNLGLGQAVFRKRTASMWPKAAQWCKMQLCEREG